MTSQLQSMFQELIRAFEVENHESTDSLFHQILQHDIHGANGLFELGIAYAKAGKFSEAIAIFSFLKLERKDDVRVPYNLGLIYAMLGTHSLAIDAYDLALQINSQDVETLINKGSSCIDIKNFNLALEVLNLAISIKSDIPEAWSNKGVALNNLKLYEQSIAAYNEAINLYPNYYEAWANKSEPLRNLKRFEEAIQACNEALILNPDYAEAHTNKGMVYYDLKQYTEAIQYNQALRLRPDYVEAYSNQAIALNELKRYEEAITHYDKALSIKPDYAECWLNKGVTLHELKRYEEAITHYDKALKLKPDYAECWSNMGIVLSDTERYQEAIAHYDKALSIKPDYAECWLNKGVTLQSLERYQEAIAHYDKAISLKPDYAEAYSNKGNVLNELELYEDAITQYDKALSLKPDYAEGWSNKGITLQALKRYEDAITHYDKALSLKPEMDWVRGDLLHAKMRISSWSGLQDGVQTMADQVLRRLKVTSPFAMLALLDDPLLHKKAAVIYAQEKYPVNSALGLIPKRPKEKKIRIAYFSPDFRNHPVALLTAELFEIHDRSRFEVIAFSLIKTPIGDDVSTRLKNGFDRFIEVEDLSDQAVAKLARELGVDIAIDLSGPTQDSRTGIFAYRAAPIQVNWLGYPGTIGAEFIDYIVADGTIIPKSHQQFYVEKVVCLPNTYLVDDSKRVASARVFTKQECGLPEDAFVFCCFNNDYKFNPLVLDSWSRILHGAKQSVLWLSENNTSFRANIIAEFEKRGVEGSRVIFAKRVELMTDHLARYRLADLFSDTCPYNAHTTAIDSLKAGVPVLTLPGESFASRVAAGLLNAIGLPELIANSPEEYEAWAIDLASNPDQINALKADLMAKRAASPLFDTPLFAKNLETAYLKMYERYQADLKPEHISF